MKDGLSAEQVAFYGEHGYLVIPDALDRTIISDLRLVAERAAAQASGMAESDERLDLEDSHTLEQPRVRRLKTPHRFYPEVRRATREPAIIECLLPILGPNIRFYDSKFNFKSPRHGAPVEWHQDWSFYPHTNDHMLAVGIMIDDCGEENGPLLVIPGSHRGPLYDHHIDGIFAGAIHLTACDVDFSAAVPLTGSAGSITLHHTRTIHGSALNRSSRPRRFLLMEYAAADAWPLMGTPGIPEDLDEFNSRIVAGEPTLQPRLESVPVRVPLPPGPPRGTVYEYHRTMKNRSFTWHENGEQPPLA